MENSKSIFDYARDETYLAECQRYEDRRINRSFMACAFLVLCGCAVIAASIVNSVGWGLAVGLVIAFCGAGTVFHALSR